MKKLTFNLLVAVPSLALFLHVARPDAVRPRQFAGMCDASAAVALDHEYFAAADDELSVLRIYSRWGGQRAVAAVDVAPFLGLSRRDEIDLEGAARLGDRIYWISSHGRNAAGEEQPSRRRLFATTGLVTNGVIEVRPVGRPYAGLLSALVGHPALAGFNLAEAARRKPKSPGGLSIEGLCATPEGHLLIGFRNPIPDGKALVVPLLNPGPVIDGQEPARLGHPILLDLQGLGIRSLSHSPGRYWIVAGSFDGGQRSRVFHWRGGAEVPQPLDFPETAELNPEGMTFFHGPEGSELWMVSDDGTMMVNGVECKKLKDPRLKRFRAVGIPLRRVCAAK